MKPSFRFHIWLLTRAAVLTLFALALTGPARAQSDFATQRAHAFQLMEALKYTEALPILERLAETAPKDADVQFYLGFALLGKAKNTEDKTAAREMRIRARAAFVRSKEAGNDSQLVQGLIDGIPADGGFETGMSQNEEASRLMEQGEAAFSRGKLDEALAAYQNALRLDPKLYHAALFSGDVFTHRGKYADAEIWYQKAIAIDPTIETAYRYSATPLMKQNKTDQARERYIEAFIVEPYNRLALNGLIQWAQATRTSLGHPQIDVPEIKLDADGKASTTLNINPANLDDGSLAWTSYVTTREQWRKEKFAKLFPAEKSYRHTLQEEADALRSVVSVAKSLKSKDLNPQLKTLAKLDEEGLLEAYVLMARATREIAQDHREYLKTNREKLRRYVAKYVIGVKK